MGCGKVMKRDRYLLAGAILMTALAGCSTPAERAAWAAKRQAPQAVIVKSASNTPSGETSVDHTSDGFPTFNNPPTAANVQISNDQATDMQKQLTALGAKRKAGMISEAEYNRRVAEMRKLGADHGQDTLNEIQQQTQSN
jgi:hypothetical protein